MTNRTKKIPSSASSLAKTPTGISGLDEITFGGLPTGRCTLICGSAGCGKTIMALEFLIKGAILYGEPGVFVAFEETAEEIAQNVASLGFNVQELVKKGLLHIDFIQVNR